MFDCERRCSDLALAGGEADKDFLWLRKGRFAFQRLRYSDGRPLETRILREEKVSVSGNRPSGERQHPPLVFAWFELRSNALKVSFAINQASRSTGTHVVIQFMIAPLFEHRQNRAVVK